MCFSVAKETPELLLFCWDVVMLNSSGSFRKDVVMLSDIKTPQDVDVVMLIKTIRPIDYQVY